MRDERGREHSMPKEKKKTSWEVFSRGSRGGTWLQSIPAWDMPIAWCGIRTKARRWAEGRAGAAQSTWTDQSWWRLFEEPFEVHRRQIQVHPCWIWTSGSTLDWASSGRFGKFWRFGHCDQWDTTGRQWTGRRAGEARPRTVAARRNLTWLVRVLILREWPGTVTHGRWLCRSRIAWMSCRSTCRCRSWGLGLGESWLLTESNYRKWRVVVVVVVKTSTRICGLMFSWGRTGAV